MKLLYTIFIFLCLTTIIYAQKIEHHEHIGTTQIKVTYDTFDFKNSKKKDDGKRYHVEFDHQSNMHHYQFYYSKTYTNTIAPIPKDLEIDKYAFKYQYVLDKQTKLSFSYISINDNLVKDTDNGDIYGLGYHYKSLSFTQYFSDYKNFDVYQSEIKYGLKKSFGTIDFMGALLGKYIKLDEKEKTPFSQNAKNEYVTLGINLHAHYDDWHLSAGTYFGKRAFAVMDNGFKVQHHAMEFRDSIMFGIGKEFENILLHLRYTKHTAKELPDDNVKVEGLSFSVDYKF